MTATKFREEAIDFFKKAYNYFDEMMHLKGMYLSKRHEESLYEVPLDHDGENDVAFVKKRAKKMYQMNRRDYFEHIKKYGYKSCCYIPRHHGEEISLLTEIVEENKKQPLFKTPNRAKNSPTKLGLHHIG